MANRRTARNQRKKSPARRPRRGRQRRAHRQSFAIPQLEQRHFDLIGLALVGLAAFFAFVFYLGWDGGTVGEALAGVLKFAFGAVAYLVPITMFGAGAVLVLRPLIPSARPFKAGAGCLLLGLMLGLAAGSFGLGPNDPARSGFMDPGFFKSHGGVVGEVVYWVTKTLVQQLGTDLLFLFLVFGGSLLLTGASVGGIVRTTHEGVSSTSRRVRQSTGEFAAILTGRRGTAEAAAGERPAELAEDGTGAGANAWETLTARDSQAPQAPPEVEPVVRATHVEAPALDGSTAEPVTGAEESAGAGAPASADLSDGPAQAVDRPRQDAAISAWSVGAGGQSLPGQPGAPGRSGVTEADDFPYKLPPPAFLQRSARVAAVDTKGEQRTGAQLVETLSHFGVDAGVVGAVAGPHVTRYELRLAPGTKMSKVAQLKDDLAYALAATDVRILAPIPGKQAVGVEVPNSVRRIVHLGDVYQQAPEGWSPLTVWLGKDIAGKAIGTDLAKQPHLLVAGTTGSGKSGAVNAMLSSILMRATPQEVKLVLVDPKQVELNHYDSVPHLLTPVVTSPRLAANVLRNLIREMEARYSIMSLARTRSLVELNRLREKSGERPLPYILCVIDELGDLMMVAPAEVEDAIIRLAQKSRAVGIHLVLATQRPSADIITGAIKANVPARIAFAVSSQIDSRVILDQNGAESLLGQGDMLFRPASESRPARIQGAFISEEEIEKVTAHWRRQGEPELNEELLEAVESDQDDGPQEFDPDADDLLPDAIATVVQMGTASTSMLQRRLRVGYTRAGRLVDMMERRGVISGYEGSKARQVLVTEADLPRVLAALAEPATAVAGNSH